MKKIVINGCYGGFGLSDEAIVRYAEIKGINLVSQVDQYDRTHYYVDSVSDDNYFSDFDIPRDDPALIQVVEELQHDADGYAANLKIVEIPDDVEWHIAEYDGSEHVAENHRKWY
jgi:hypothetical protein